MSSYYIYSNWISICLTCKLIYPGSILSAGNAAAAGPSLLCQTACEIAFRFRLGSHLPHWYSKGFSFVPILFVFSCSLHVSSIIYFCVDFCFVVYLLVWIVECFNSMMFSECISFSLVWCTYHTTLNYLYFFILLLKEHVYTRKILLPKLVTAFYFRKNLVEQYSLTRMCPK